MSANNIFQVFQNCLNNKDFNPENGLNSFMFCRFLGSNPQTLQIANMINMLYKTLPEEAQYDIVRYFHNKPKFIKFIGSTKEDSNLKEIMEQYKVSRETAREYNEILNFLKSQ